MGPSHTYMLTILFLFLRMAFFSLPTTVKFVGNHLQLIYEDGEVGGRVTYQVPYDAHHLPRMLLFSSPETSIIYDGRTSDNLTPVLVTWTRQPSHPELHFVPSAELNFANRALLSECHLFALPMTNQSYNVIPILTLAYDEGPSGLPRPMTANQYDDQEAGTTLGASPKITPLASAKYRRGVKRRLEEAFNRIHDLEEDALLQLSPSPVQNLEGDILLRPMQSPLASAGSMQP